MAHLHSIRTKSPRSHTYSSWWRPLVMTGRHPVLWLSVALILNIFEGAARKWLPGFEGGAGRALAYFSKDLCLALAVALVWARPARPIAALETARDWGAVALGALGLGAVLSLIQGFNGVGAVLSLKAVVVLPVLGFCYAGRVRDFPLLGFAAVAAGLTIVNAPLALMQNGLFAQYHMLRMIKHKTYQSLANCTWLNGLERLRAFIAATLAHGEGQSGFMWIVFTVHIRPITAVAFFQAHGVEGATAGGNESEGLSSLP